MAFFDKSKPRGYTLIAAELTIKRRQLAERKEDLTKAELHVLELKGICASLETQVAELEHDQHALDRGYLAIMGDQKEATT